MEVIVAINIIKKKIIARYFPKYIWENIKGKLMKVNPVPPVNGKLNENKLGMIINPEKIPTKDPIIEV